MADPTPPPEQPFDAALARRWLALALAGIERDREAIDALNVYPVPDGDTGTNLHLTLRRAAAEVAEVGDDAFDCPVCETPAALTPARIAALRERVAAESGLAAVRGRAESEVTALGSDVAALRAGVERSVPPVALLAGDELRVHASFVHQLLGDVAEHDDAVAEMEPLVRAGAGCMPRDAWDQAYIDVQRWPRLDGETPLRLPSP